jgi:hypothetical protein
MRKTMRTIGATLAIVGVMGTFVATGVFSAVGTRSGGETILDAQPEFSDFSIDPGASILTGTVSVDGEVAAEGAPLFFLDGRTLAPLQVAKASSGTALIGLGGQVLNPDNDEGVPSGSRLTGTSPELEVSDDASVLIGLPGLTQISPRAVPADTLTTNRLPDDTRSDIELRVIS